MSELKECPFCGQQPKGTKYREFGKKTREYFLYHCPNKECPSYFTKPGSMTAEDWNNRPIEDALCARAERAEQMVERFVAEIDKHKGGYPAAGDSWYGMGKLHALVAEWKAR
jgi:hypothetical protein